MGFFGSTTAEMRDLFFEMVRDGKITEVYVGCSGGFGIERALSRLGVRLHGCDVNAYTCAVGKYYSGQQLEHELDRDYEYFKQYDYVEDYWGSPKERFACLLLLSDMARFVGRERPYYLRMVDAYRVQWPRLFDKMVEKIDAFPLELASFDCEDVMTWIDRVPRDAAFLSCPPYEGFSMAFEAQFKVFEKMICWDKPSFQPLDDLDAMIAKMRQFRVWGIATNRRYEYLEDDLRAIVRAKRGTDSFYLYSNAAPPHAAANRNPVEPFPVPPLGKNDDVGTTLELVPLTGPQLDLLRAEYLDATIAPSQAMLAFAVVTNGRLVGAFGVSRLRAATNFKNVLPQPYVYGMTDFAVSTSRYKRLAKLVLYAMLSQEARYLIERSWGHRIQTIISTAFTEKPVSMKYRGMFTLLSRNENKDPNGKPFMLNYGARMGQWSLADGLEEWKQKHGGVTARA